MSGFRDEDPLWALPDPPPPPDLWLGSQGVPQQAFTGADSGLVAAQLQKLIFKHVGLLSLPDVETYLQEENDIKINFLIKLA